MIFRAVFWIGLVSLLAPHEPDLGLGRPGAGTPIPAAMISGAVAGLSRPGQICQDHAAACAGGLGLLDGLQVNATRGLATVKAEIDASMRARAAQQRL